ncbi:MAG: hypothetical protein ACFCU2_05815 [Acidimicrobiia bacterium]
MRLASRTLDGLEGADFDAIQDWFHDQDLSDGLPIVPPTPERVAAMVAGSGRDAGSEVGVIDPEKGVATVEKLAINAVMAGCKPGYMPVVIAAVEAICEPIFNLHAVQATTNPATPLFIVNGPIRRAIGMNTDRNLLGPGNRANATIGRALRLVMRNIGGAYVGVDQATHGSPAKYTLCIAEDEESSPWQPLHVDLGYEPDDSTVSVSAIESVINSTAVWWTAPSLLKMLAKTMRTTATSQFFSRGTPTLMMSPAHAGVFVRAGYDKQRLREELWDAGKVPLDDFPPEGNIPQGDWTIDGDRVLLCESPEDFQIIVAGGTEGNASHSVFFSGFCLSKGVTKKVRFSG